jgi:[ribosomal protein S5]-alanine N-acetyltransferase
MAADFEVHTLLTPRLELHLVKPLHLLQLADGEFNNSSLDPLGFSNPHNVLVEGPSPVRWRAPQVRDDVTLNRWFIRWIVLKESMEVIGSISFHAQPNENGMIEIGLGIAEQFQNQGFATESLVVMWNWVCTQPGVETLRYTVSPENTPSQKIIAKFGFTHMGIQIDDEDGPEDIYEMSARVWLARTANRLFPN